MKIVNILIGAAGVGKSSYVLENKKENDIWLSSDNLRIELFGSLDKGWERANSGIVFEEMHKSLVDFVINGKDNTTLFYDATNTLRKHRLVVYQMIKEIAKENNVNVKVIATLIAKPLKTILAQNKSRPETQFVNPGAIKRMYKQLQIPRVNLDCDEIEVVGNFEDFKDEINETILEVHNSPYHAETLLEHTSMVVKSIQDDNTLSKEDKEILSLVGELHDLGKSVCRKEIKDPKNPAHIFFIENHGKQHQFMGHECVSAVYALLLLHGRKECELVCEIILQHMSAHNGLSEKIIERNNLDENTIRLANMFSTYDKRSNVKHRLYKEYLNRLEKNN